MPRVHVTSEIGALRAVLVHTPGNELVAVTPGNREAYLYDDIIDLDSAQREHRRLVAVLERYAEVYEVRDLLTELVGRADVREFLTTRALEIVPSDALAKQLAELPPGDLVALMVEGAIKEAGPIARALNEVGYALPPLPNLFFPRDVGIVIGAHSIIGSMRYGVRWTEELLIKALFRYHEKLENEGILYDGSEEKRSNYTLEGGDVHPIRPDLLVLGFSERSSPAALDHLCDVAFGRCGVTDVVVVVMPAERTAIHLDMIFTQLDRELCCVYPPHFVGPERLAVLHRRKKSKGVKEVPNFFAAMQAVDQPLEPIFCGGNNRALQEREQWASAERVATTLVGADPRVSRLPDGRWTLAAAAATSPALDACRFAVVDVETTGTSPRRGDRIIEIAVAVLEGDRVTTAFQSLVNPGVPIGAFVSRLTGIDAAAVRDAPCFAAVADRLLDHLAGTVFVAHNVRFDWTFLLVELERARSLLLQGPRVCTLRLARRLVPALESRSLDTLARFFGIDIARRHRAGPDAAATARILQRLVGIAKEQGAVTLADLMQTRNAERGTRNERRLVSSAFRVPRSDFA